MHLFTPCLWMLLHLRIGCSSCIRDWIVWLEKPKIFNTWLFTKNKSAITGINSSIQSLLTMPIIFSITIRYHESVLDRLQRCSLPIYSSQCMIKYFASLFMGHCMSSKECHEATEYRELRILKSQRKTKQVRKFWEMTKICLMSLLHTKCCF